MVMMGLWIKGDQKSRDTAMTFHNKLLSAIKAQKVWIIPVEVHLGSLILPFNSPNGMSRNRRHV